MKRLLPVLLALLTLLAVSCQGDKASRWTRVFGEKGESEYVTSVLAASDGGFLVLGAACDTERGDVCRTYLLRTDEKGNELWNKSIDEYQRGRMTLSVFETTDKGFIVFGASRIEKRYNVIVIKADRKGNRLWSKTIETDIKSYLSVAGESADSFIITGVTSTEDGIKVIEADEEGNIVSRMILDVPIDDPALSGFVVKSTSDGGFIIACTKYEPDDRSDIYVIRIDENGNKLWSRPLGDAGTAETPVHILETSDEGIVIIGSIGSTGSLGLSRADDRNIYIVRLKADGTRLWSNTYGNKSLIESAGEVVQTADGGFIIAGRRAPPVPGYQNTYIVRVDEQGNDLWSRTFENHDIWSRASSVLQTPEGGFIVAGEGYWLLPDRMERDIFLMKIDSEGNYDPLR